MTTQHRQPAGVSTGGQFSPDSRGRAAVTLGTGAAAGEPVLIGGVPLTDATPTAVDEVLAEIYGRYQQAMDAYRRIQVRIEWLRSPMFSGVRRGSDEDIEQAEMEAAQAHNDALEIRLEGRPYEAEFRRRGGWTRAYLVDNPDGHLHSSMHCSTCNNGRYETQFHWVTALSGAAEAAIIDAAGSDACTTCYPDAPVETLRRASRIDSPNRRAAREVAEERARRQAEKTAAEVPLTEKVDGKRSFKTERGAMNHALSQADSLLFYRRGGRQHPMEGQWVREIRTIVDAVAAKRGVDREQVKAEIIGKVQKKARRDSYQVQVFPDIDI